MNINSQRPPRLWEDMPLESGTVESAIAKYRMNAAAPRYEQLMRAALAIAMIAFLASSVALLIKQGL